MPKRAYAIVRLALDLGLRPGEIAHLKLDDIDWQAATLMLRGTKSLRHDVVPLPAKTGKALADYLQHERPAIRHPAVFIRQVAGRSLPITSCAIQKVIKRSCHRIGLPDASAHVLRHTVACRLVERGSSLKEVAGLLRHRSLNSTLIYAKLDTPPRARDWTVPNVFYADPSRELPRPPRARADGDGSRRRSRQMPIDLERWPSWTCRLSPMDVDRW
jgi:integrase